MVTLKFTDLLNAFEFVSFGGSIESDAFINLDTGAIYYLSNDLELEEETPEDLETSERYLAIPHKTDLNLGRSLVLSFVEKALPNGYETTAGYFRSQGAYSRFKELLESRGIINQWYEYERNAIEVALKQWCQEHDIQLTGQE